ncbi:polysaccharide deacetylase family protein [Pseudonocardia thermophila]|uniref:polysaccharide deacetylase family protein n=1 Tax=Pseudonocardia thermophila TaxID=1848 RepID=UPI00248F41A3|nr:polysaccharide deacetylase family protein [Pseudonocardia thermophila]
MTAEPVFDRAARRWDQVGQGPVRDLVGYGSDVPLVHWPGGARVAVSVVLNIEEGSERSPAFGDADNEPNWETPRDFPRGVRDLSTESVFEYGSRAGVHRALRVLREFEVPATAFASAVALAVNPDAVRQLIDDGHEVCCHGWRWTEQWTMTREEERRRIHDAVELIEELTGTRPVGWYSRYGPSVHTRELLHEAGFTYDCDAYNDDLPYYVAVRGAPHLVIPYSAVYNDCHFADKYSCADDFLSDLRRALDHLWREGAQRPRMMSVGLHPRIVGQAARADALREFLAYARGKGGVWFARRDEIAQVWLTQFPPSAPDPGAGR